MRILGILVVSAALSHVTVAQATPCVLGYAFGYREFSLPRNSVCVINRQGVTQLVSVKITVRPKLGRFGSASVSQWAYRAGNVAGDDYFEYVSTESLAGTPHDYRVRNVVHVTP